MASDDDGKLTGFPLFLTTVRYVVAGVVAVLAAVVVVMVIVVALRPEKVRLSILRGYVEATDLWQVSRVEIRRQIADDTTAAAATTTTVIYSSSSGFGDFSVGSTSTGDEPVTYRPAERVNFLLSLSAANPSGRADIDCDNITVSLLDVPGAPYNLTVTAAIAAFPLEERFRVERESSHTVRKWLTLNDTGALSRIAETYGGRISFQAMLQVNATVTTTALVKTSPKAVVYYCWPVTVRTFVPSAATDDVTCKTSDEMGYSIGVGASSRSSAAS
ncbi:hypothetical protein ACP70R_042178 [Stipagrostis hirtigluma subsp. patula]